MRATLVLLCLARFATTAWAFEPISPDQASTLSGNTVYAAVSDEQLGDKLARFWVDAGTEFKVTSVSKTGGDPAFWSVTGETGDGRTLRFPLYRLSSSRLKFDLANPGDAETFLKNVYLDAAPLASRVAAINEKYNHGKVTDVNDAATKFAMEQTLLADATLLKTFVLPAMPQTVLADPKRKWIVDAKDPSLYDLLIDKAPKGQRERARAIGAALDALGYAASDTDLTALVTRRDLEIANLRRSGSGPKAEQAERDVAASYDKQMKAQLARAAKRFADAAKQHDAIFSARATSGRAGKGR